MASWDWNSDSALAERIERYLDGNPRAADTAEGVRNWWLGGGAHMVTGAEVERAIELLLKRGTLQRQVMADGTCIYGRVLRGAGLLPYVHGNGEEPYADAPRHVGH